MAPRTAGPGDRAQRRDQYSLGQPRADGGARFLIAGRVQADLYHGRYGFDQPGRGSRSPLQERAHRVRSCANALAARNDRALHIAVSSVSHGHHRAVGWTGGDLIFGRHRGWCGARSQRFATVQVRPDAWWPGGRRVGGRTGRSRPGGGDAQRPPWPRTDAGGRPPGQKDLRRRGSIGGVRPGIVVRSPD